MTFQDWDECLKFLEVLTKWPPIVLLIALVFRSAIAKKLADLKKITIKEKTEIAFETLVKLKKVAAETSPELFQQFVLNIPHSVITEGEAGADDKAGKVSGGEETRAEDVDEDGNDESAETDRVELDNQLKELESE